MTCSLEMLKIKVFLKGAKTKIVPLYSTHCISEQKRLRLVCKARLDCLELCNVSEENRNLM